MEVSGEMGLVWRSPGLDKKQGNLMLVTNGDLGCALRAPLPSYRLLSVRFAHDGEQSLQEHVQEALHHHLYLLQDVRLLERAAETHG